MFVLLFTSFLFCCIFPALARSKSIEQRQQQQTLACNNSPDLCSRSYGSITHLGAHDSPFVGDDLSHNQNINSTAQLDAGVRLLSAQVHENDGEWDLCHTSCFLENAGSLRNWLTEINGWMDANPNEVVTLLLVNSDSATASDLAGEFQASGITKYAYTPPTSAGPIQTWPTLQALIQANTRLMTFVAPVDDPTGIAPYLMPEFNYIFENEFETTSPNNFTCAPDRPSNLVGSSAATSSAISAGYLPLMNHFLYSQQPFGIVIPDRDAVDTTNSPDTTGSVAGALGSAAFACQTEYGRQPAFILVDFFDQGPAIATVDALNGVVVPAGRASISRLRSSGQSGSSADQSNASNRVAGDPPTGSTAGLALVAVLGYVIAFM